MFHVFNSQEERRKLGGSAFVGIQYMEYGRMVYKEHLKRKPSVIKTDGFRNFTL